MKSKSLITSAVLVWIALLINFQNVLAHESITVGDYEIEVGWLNEPPIAGQYNAIVVSVINTASSQPVEDVSSLTVTLSYGGQEKTLTLQPSGEETPGQFSAPVLPTVPGQYEVKFGGTLGDTSVDAETHVEEVESADVLAFPATDSLKSPSEGNSWLVWLSLVIGLIGAGLGFLALRRTSM